MKELSTVDSAMQWLSRTLAILLFMLAPGFAGRELDRRLGTHFLTPAGFVFGTVLATIVLLIMARKFTPPAEGEPLPFDDEKTDGADED